MHSQAALGLVISLKLENFTSRVACSMFHNIETRCGGIFHPKWGGIAIDTVFFLVIRKREIIFYGVNFPTKQFWRCFLVHEKCPSLAHMKPFVSLIGIKIKSLKLTRPSSRFCRCRISGSDRGRYAR